MFFTIDASNGVAIYEQIIRQVKYAIADGALHPGQLLPSVRTLSVELAINPNTVARAFQQLQQDGVLESIRGRGLAVLPEAVPRCKAMRIELLEQRMRGVLSEALHGGLDIPAVRSMIERVLAELGNSIQAVGTSSGSSAETG